MNPLHFHIDNTSREATIFYLALCQLIFRTSSGSKRDGQRSLGLSRAHIGIVLVLAAAALWVGTLSPAIADTDPDEYGSSEVGGILIGAPRQDREAARRVAEKRRALKHEQAELEHLKRTKHPFHSDRALRHSLRRNEAEQGWYKDEARQLDFTIRRQERAARFRHRLD
jgi:hypothetical protein